MAELVRDSDISTMDNDAANQGEGATGGIGVPASTVATTIPTTVTMAAPALDRSFYLSSSRDGRGEGGLGRDFSERQRSPDGNHRELEEAYRRIAQQDEMLDQLQRRLHELKSEHFREVRERPKEDRGWADRHCMRTRATDHSEVSGKFLYPGSGNR